MKTKGYIILLVVALLAGACERTLEFESPADETTDDMVINAVAVANAPFTVYLNRAIPAGQTSSGQASGYISSGGGGRADTPMATSIRDARVHVEVNGQASYDLSFNDALFGYWGDYVPREGDRVEVTVSAQGQELRATTTVPAKPKVEILEHEVIPENPYREVEGLEFLYYTDTIMRLKCRITDAGGEGYYRLRVRSERDVHKGSGSTINGEVILSSYSTEYGMTDIYFSEDELFADGKLMTNYGGWPAGFSNVFDNSLMRGKGSYTFTVESPKVKDFRPVGTITSETAVSDKPLLPPRVMVELQAISPEFYRYLKSMQLYRITQNDKNAEPVLIYSNVQNGWGILGALSYDRHFVEFGD